MCRIVLPLPSTRSSGGSSPLMTRAAAAGVAVGCSSDPSLCHTRPYADTDTADPKPQQRGVLDNTNRTSLEAVMAVVAQRSQSADASAGLQPTLWRTATLGNLVASLAGDSSLRVRPLGNPSQYALPVLPVF